MCLSLHLTVVAGLDPAMRQCLSLNIILGPAGRSSLASGLLPCYHIGMAKHPNRPRDTNQLAKRIVDLATGSVVDERPESPTPAQEFARSGGLKGGRARADALTPEKRREIAQKAAAKRWGNR